MKSLIAVLFLFVSFSSVAEVIGSKFEIYQQKMITEAVYKKCGITSSLKQIKHSEVTQSVDQGIKDIYMKTMFVSKVRVDQMIFDHYTVIVESSLTSAYDYKNKTWGVFSVENVTCVQD
jgi:hypothetical protein